MLRRTNTTTDTSTHPCGASPFCGADPRSHESALYRVAHRADRRTDRGTGRCVAPAASALTASMRSVLQRDGGA